MRKLMDFLLDVMSKTARAVAVGSSAVLGVVNCFLQVCQTSYKERALPAAWMVVDQPKVNSHTSCLIAALIPHDESHLEYWLPYLQVSAAKRSELPQNVAHLKLGQKSFELRSWCLLRGRVHYGFSEPSLAFGKEKSPRQELCIWAKENGPQPSASYEIQPRKIFPYNAIAMGVFCEAENDQAER